MATFNWTKFQRSFTTGTIYYMDSVLGVNTNAGTTNAPKKTILTTFNITYILSDGEYDLTGVNLTGVSIVGSKRTIVKNLNTANSGNKFYNCLMINCTVSSSVQLHGVTAVNCSFTTISLFTNHERPLLINCSGALGGVSTLEDKTTFVGGTYTITANYNNGSFGVKSCIFEGCNIGINVALTNGTGFQNNIIGTSCLFDFNGTNYRSISYWEGQMSLVGMAAIEAAYKVVYPTGVLSSSNNKVADPLFVDPTNQNYSLQQSSPAIGWGLSGINAGAFGIGKKVNIVANSVGILNSVDTTTDINTTITPDAITVDHNDQNIIPGTGIAEVIANVKFPNPSEVGIIDLGLTDYQSTGEIVDANLQIDPAVIVAGTALEDGQIYQVAGANITYGSVLTPGTRFTASGTGSFTGTGTVSKIIEYPNYKTIALRWKLSVANNVISAGTNLTANNWYEVVEQISYNGNTRIVGEIFKAETGVLSFTGGSVKEVFADSDTWRLFIYNEYPYFKRVGDTINGAIDLTNGQTAYHDAANDARQDFHIVCKYLQIKINVQSTSPKP